MNARSIMCWMAVAVAAIAAAIAATPLNDIPGTTEVYSAAETDAAITAATNSIKVDEADFTPSNAVLVATIEEVAPPPGNYGTVSNRAMGAVQSLQPAYDYTDAALGTFASTGAVARATVYGTPTRWTDATGCVWEVSDAFTPWQYEKNEHELGLPVWRGEAWYVDIPNYPSAILSQDANATWLMYAPAALETIWYRNIVPNGQTNLVGRVALTNDIPDVSGYATPADVTAAIREQSLGGIWDSRLGVWWTPIMQNGALRYETNAVQNATDTLAVVSNIVASGGLASVDAVDAKISTNNAAFVSAVLAVPLTGADAGDLAEIAEYGGYGTVGAALLALIAGLAALKRRMATAETAVSENATAVASVRADLPYRLVEPGKWEFSDGQTHTVYGPSEGMAGWFYALDDEQTGAFSNYFSTESDALAALSLTFVSVTATRASLPGHLCDRAGNRVVVTGDTTLTLPAAVPGYLRDFLVRLEISGSTVPTITFAAPTGETITYETDGDEFPVPDEAGDWLYSFTESCVAHTFAVSLKKVNVVAQGGS